MTARGEIPVDSGVDPVVARLRAAPADTGALRERLARDAQDEGLADVTYRLMGSSIGALLLAATPRGLVYTGFEDEDQDEILAMLATRIGPRVLRAQGGGLAITGGAADGAGAAGGGGIAVLDTAAAQIGEYLDGRRREFDLPLDTRLATGFRGEVQQHLRSLEYGHTATYKELATGLGRPGAVRAVGTACATNPLPLIWPCHRVLRSDGGLGGYRGGLQAKRLLLRMEAAA